jgi:ribulose-phosphate 3-epimerase
VSLIVPSILSADFTRLGQQIAEVTAAGADRIQVDVMDGHFVPNISIGTLGVKAVRQSTTLPIESHLMITNPAQYVDDFLRAGADFIIVHQETLSDPRVLLNYIREHGAKAGLAINPETPVEVLSDFLDAADLYLVMTVHPGFGGQEFIPETLSKIRALRQMLITHGRSNADLEVDGGIYVDTAPQALEAGANIFVAGSAIFGEPDGPTSALQRLRQSLV